MEKECTTGTQATWEKLLAAIEANRSELPHVGIYSEQLETQLGDLRAELARRAVLQAEMRRSTRAVNDLLTAGRNLASRISNYLKASYGPQSDKLLEFGIKPIRKRRPGSDEPDLRKEERGAPWNPTVTLG